MFAMKNMDVTSALLKLKLDMVYRNLSLEDAEQKYKEVTATMPPVEQELPPPPPPPKRKRVKPVGRKSK
jgi:hypothetical protein